MTRYAFVYASLICLLLLGACGQKGDLFLPETDTTTSSTTSVSKTPDVKEQP